MERERITDWHSMETYRIWLWKCSVLRSARHSSASFT